MPGATGPGVHGAGAPAVLQDALDLMHNKKEEEEEEGPRWPAFYVGGGKENSDSSDLWVVYSGEERESKMGIK